MLYTVQTAEIFMEIVVTESNAAIEIYLRLKFTTDRSFLPRCHGNQQFGILIEN